MSETFNNRIKFNRQGVQRNFILKARAILGISRAELAGELKISKRTLADWTREAVTISEAAAIKISKLTGKRIPRYSVINWREHFQKAGKIGGRNRFLRYGKICLNEEYRKIKWKQWWENVGRHEKPALGFQTLIKIKTPRKSKMLAEFIGILLGDGNISSYHIGITLSSEEKKYIEYVKSIIRKLFGVAPKIVRHKAKAVSIVVNRKLLVEFCEKFGFPIGDKVAHQVDIPKWIKRNKNFSRECVRGLIDTDGCFFVHNYKVGAKRYSYLKIAFTSASVPLVCSMREILINFDFNVRITKNGKDVRLEDRFYVEKYIKEIGTHNYKHQEKIDKWRVALNGKAPVC